jgi:hypothetical protein
MAKSLKHYKPKTHKNKTMRRKSRGGSYEFDGNLDGFGPHVVALHHSDDCGHCKTFKPEWKKVVKRLRKIDPALLAVAEAGPAATEHMNDTYYDTPVNGVPTIMYIHKINNNKVRPTVYTGARTADAIMEWVTKLLAKNKVKITIESDQEETPDPMPEPDQILDQTMPEPDQILDQTMPEPDHQTILDQTMPDQTMPDQTMPDPMQDPSTLTKTTDAIKTTAAAVDNKIEEGVSAVKSAFTKDLDFENLFSSKAADPTQNPEVQANGLDPTQNPDLQPARTNAAPEVPSLIGGRKHTRRAKSNRKSKRKTKRKSSRK